MYIVSQNCNHKIKVQNSNVYEKNLVIINIIKEHLLHTVRFNKNNMTIRPLTTFTEQPQDMANLTTLYVSNLHKLYLF